MNKRNLYIVLEAFIRVVLIVVFYNFCTSVYILNNNNCEYIVLVAIVILSIISQLTMLKITPIRKKWKSGIALNSILFVIFYVSYSLIEISPVSDIRIFQQMEATDLTPGLGLIMLFGTGIILASTLITKIVIICICKKCKTGDD